MYVVSPSQKLTLLKLLDPHRELINCLVSITGKAKGLSIQGGDVAVTVELGEVGVQLFTNSGVKTTILRKTAGLDGFHHGTAGKQHHSLVISIPC